MDAVISQTLKNLFSLEGRTGIVTGGSGGIGQAVCTLLANCGARIFDLSNEIHEEIHPQVTSILVDMTDKEAARPIIEKIGNMHGIDFLVNCIGVCPTCPLEEITPESWRRSAAINNETMLFAAQLAYPYLKESFHIGRIVNIASMASHLGFTSEIAAYAATKAAVLGITRTEAIEWIDDNILANSVSPGWIQTPLIANHSGERIQKILNRIPMGKRGTPKDVAQAILFLVSDASTYITGQDIVVDGGVRVFGY